MQTAGTMACLFTTMDTSTSSQHGFGNGRSGDSKAGNSNKHLKPPVRLSNLITEKRYFTDSYVNGITLTLTVTS